MTRRYTPDTLPGELRPSVFEYLLRLGDDSLILGHRLSEWCGHAPILEEDIAISNVALDRIGQASHLLKLAGQIEGSGRSEDDLAFFRDETDFRNLQLVELPKGDYGFTIARQLLFDSYSVLLFDQLRSSRLEPLAGIAAKALKECRYHVRHAREWMLRFGDGTEESHQRAQQALDTLWPYTAELFCSDSIEQAIAAAGVGPLGSSLEADWREGIEAVIAEATLKLPPEDLRLGGGRSGLHSEHLGHLLAEMQILPRSYPGLCWG
ncbi:MAG: phenylacetate-CoA oxygenase subunit PaaC [Proteobacteria bacterium]|nr:phenylacetate-CoA oxygenase subunit PaaC [Pseudomonadota bacterium]